ncbi:hypothetical protein RIR_jg33967.t1 [Rhizophagus irregularis DAOM 181602=DAOM 197198]|nr:hypothetical protein RIR_jg33967.t1 [Rhizophagus irregularis DAOM 181602=DAOM 197198]CAB5204864.1 unnamed protein product [Rhizophagus irregularis]
MKSVLLNIIRVPVSPESDEDVELCDAILDKLSLINIEELSWKDPVASLVLDENSNLIKPLDKISLQQLSEPKGFIFPKLEMK